MSVRRAVNKMTGTPEPARRAEVSLGERRDGGRGVRIDFDYYGDRYACFDDVERLRELSRDLDTAIAWLEGTDAAE